MSYYPLVKRKCSVTVILACSLVGTTHVTILHPNWCGNQFDIVDETDKYPEKYNLPKLT